MSQAQATAFHALHQDFLLLPNAWDAASARLTQELGAKAIATSSAAVAWAHGFADGNRFPIAKLVTVIEEIAKSVSVPISTDAEAGYADDLRQVSQNVTALINAGAVGINLEDGTAAHDLHLRKVEASREAAVRAGVDLYINARTDVYLKQLVPAERAVEETLRRAAALKNAGASGLFAPGVVIESEIATIAERCGMPLNVIAWPGLPDAANLKALGAKRLSAGTSVFAVAMEAARAAAVEFLETGSSAKLWPRRGEQLNYNKLFGG